MDANNQPTSYIRQGIAECFNLNELNTLCADLGIDDLAHWGEAGLCQFISDAACQFWTVAGVDQDRAILADDDTHGTLDSVETWSVWPKPDILSKSNELLSHGWALRCCVALAFAAA